jgi:glycosyltransferase involved in cell wall biosynthesis/polysaccharide pyruvyl transferase WcaK-like protein
MPKKIALFYGHVASNVGDLAINSGTIELLRSVAPKSQIDVVLLNSEKSQFLELSKLSFIKTGTARLVHFKTHSSQISNFLSKPTRLLAESGVEDSDVILLAAGEHFFRYANGENSESLFWRSLPALAAREAGKQCILLPSTLGPFEDLPSRNLPVSLLNLTQVNAVREARSKSLVEAYTDSSRIPVCLDPAFFVKRPALKRRKSGITALVLRSEGWGIRLSKESRRKFSEKFQGDAYNSTKSFQTALELAQKTLVDPKNRIHLFIQTVADQELAMALVKALADDGLEDRVEVSRPNSVDEYLEQLSIVDRVIASRFHAIILGLVVRKPVYGLFFDVHGHKIPGLFEMLGVSDHCFAMSEFNPKTLVAKVFKKFGDEVAYSTAVQSQLKILKNETVNWLSDALVCNDDPVLIADLLSARNALNNYGFEIATDGIKAAGAKQLSAIERVSKAAAARDSKKLGELKSDLAVSKKDQVKLNTQLSKAVDELREKQTTCSELTDKLTKKVNLLRESEKQCTLLGEKLATRENLLKEYEIQSGELTKKLSSTESSLKESQIQSDELKKKLSSTESSLKESQIQSDELTKKLSSTESSLKESQIQSDELTKKLSSTESSLKESQIQSDELTKKLSSTESSLKESQIQSDELKKKLSSTEFSLKESQIQSDELKKKLSSTESSLKETQIQSDELKKKLSSTESSLKESQIQSDELKKKLSDTENLLHERDTKCHELTEKLGLAKEDLADAQVETARKDAILEMQHEIRTAIESASKAHLTSIRRTQNYKIGTKILESFQSWKLLSNLPKKILEFYASYKSSKFKTDQWIINELGGESFPIIIESYEKGGFDSVELLLIEIGASSSTIAQAYTVLGRHLQRTQPESACNAAKLAYRADPKPFRAKWWAFRLYEAGHAIKASALLETLPNDILVSNSEDKRAIQIHNKAKLLLGRKRMNVLHPLRNSKNNNYKSELVELYESKGIESIVAEIDKNDFQSEKEFSLELLRVGKLLYEAGKDDAYIQFARKALDKDHSFGVCYAAYLAAERTSNFEMAERLMATIESHPEAISNESQQKRILKLKSGVAYHLSVTKLIESKKPRQIQSISKRICYVLHNSLPYSSGGYSTRAHGVATGLKATGYDIQCVTRPGFPSDIDEDLEANKIELNDIIEGINYTRIIEPSRKKLRFVEYIPAAAKALQNHLIELKPEFVIAASNYVVALPVAIACRRLGIPFAYEVRGFWEITRMSRDKEYFKTPAFSVQKKLEAAVCNSANQVFTLNNNMRDELVKRGVNQNKIELLPNSCNTKKFIPQNRDNVLAKTLNIPKGTPVIGYIGTFVDYEGLELLASACVHLKNEGIDFRLLLVGNENVSSHELGPISDEIVNIAQKGGFDEWLIMTGRVSHDKVENYYSLIDISAFPRKPWPVCEMVSPMKPLEALSMEKAVVVSSVKALSEIIKEGETGLIFEKDCTVSLGQTLKKLVESPELRIKLGKAGRNWVCKERTWHIIGEKAASLISKRFH